MNAANEKPPGPEWLFYILSFFIPVLGIVLGVIYASKSSRACRSFGQVCLVLGVINLVLGCCGFSCTIGPGIGSF